MNTTYLLLGGNLGRREENLGRARELINNECGTITRSSKLYETAAWGKTDQPAFLNQALELQTELDPVQLIQRLLDIENLMGRVRDEKNGPRLIDIDILLFNNEEYNLPFLKIPHPEMQRRRFALMPLTEIAAEMIHPVMNRTVRELLDDCTDRLSVEKYS